MINCIFYIVQCEEPLGFDHCFRPSFSHFATIRLLYNVVVFTNILSARKTARKITQILLSLGFQTEVKSIKSVKYSS